MAEINDSSQFRFEGDIFKKQIGKTIDTPKPLLTGAEQIENIGEPFRQNISNFGYYPKYSEVYSISKNGHRIKTTLGDKAIFVEIPLKENPKISVKRLLLPVRSRLIFNPDHVEWITINLGKSIESSARKRKMSQKILNEVMPELIEHSPEISRLKLLPQEVSLRKED